MEGVRQGSERGEMAAAISTGLVQLHRQHYGKGPTKAKTYFVNDTVLCMLQGGFTTIERTLIDDGQEETVLRMRRGFQSAMEGEFTSLVQEATGRKVIVYMSQVHQGPDVAAEIFVLEPNDGSGEQAGDGALAGPDELALAAPAVDGDGRQSPGG
jgi:uncharacterized protein YbcI